MADCKQSVHEFIQSTFSPMVAVFCSEDSDTICQKNNLTFIELVQPFSKLTSEVHIKDPSNLAHAVHNLQVMMTDFNSSIPNPSLSRKILTEIVANSQPVANDNNVIMTGEYNIQINASTPWFELYRDVFLQSLPQSDHEFIRAYLACIFVVSTNHVDPLDAFHKLSLHQHQQQHQKKTNSWFCPNVFKYYVLLHDVTDGEESKAEAVYQSMKSTYGAHACHLLQINSCNPKTSQLSAHDKMPDPWCQYISRKITVNDVAEETDQATSATQADVSPADVVLDLEDLPSQLTEASVSPEKGSGLVHISVGVVENAAEAYEDQVAPPPSTPVEETIDHPLSPDNEEPPSDLKEKSASTDSVRDKANMDPLSSNSGDTAGKPQSSVEQRKQQPHGMCLSLSDHDRLRVFVHDFCVRGLIPYVERQIRTLHEQLVSRKSIHRSFFSATKKWFGGNKPATFGHSTHTAGLGYSQEAPELQVRRLADLCFMFQIYELAYQSYHTAKRDFNNDHAWPHFAGALEMAALSVFMLGLSSQRQYPHHYVDSAINTYSNMCKMLNFAARSTLVSTEILKYYGMHGDAAMQFIRMTNEESDLRSALLLEQAAHCFIRMPRPMVRKYAFHMILAGHRFSKAGQRKHALRAYSHALQVYKGRKWSLAEDHINFTIGRQSFNLKMLENAANSFKHLLTYDSLQPPNQQQAFLREYLFVYKQLLAQSEPERSCTLDQLALPAIISSTIKVLLGNLPIHSTEPGKTCITGTTFDTHDVDMEIWDKLEYAVFARLYAGLGSLPHFHPNRQCFSNKTLNTHFPLAVIDETIYVELQLQNPLQIPLVLSDICLLWTCAPGNSNPISNENRPTEESEASISTEVISQIVLDTLETRPIILKLVPHKKGKLHIVGVAYNLGTQSNSEETPGPGITAPVAAKLGVGRAVSIRGKQSLEVQGPRLNNTKAEKASKSYAQDRRLDPLVVNPMPCLQVYFHGFPHAMLCGEVKKIDIEFHNIGKHAAQDVYVASSHPLFFTFGTDEFDKNGMEETVSANTDVRSCSNILVAKVPLPKEGFLPDGRLRLPMWLYGPGSSGTHRIHLLFYYLPQEQQHMSKLRHRVLRHTAEITVSPSVAIDCAAFRQSSDKSDSLALSLQINNINRVQDASIAEVRLKQVSCTSREWSLHSIGPLPAMEMKLNPGEKINLCCKVVRSEVSETGDNNGPRISNLIKSEGRDRQGEFPVFHHSVNATGSDKSSTSVDNGIQSAVHVGLHLIVHWEAFIVDDAGTSRTAIGQLFVPVNMLNLPVTIPAKVSSSSTEQFSIMKQAKDTDIPSLALRQLVQYNVIHPSVVRHNFKKSQLCTVAVKLMLRNCSDMELYASVSTNSRTPDNSTNMGSSINAPSDYLLWCGPCFYKLSLFPHEISYVNMKVCVSAPGVYNLSDLLVKASHASDDKLDDDATVQSSIPASLLTVENNQTSSGA